MFCLAEVYEITFVVIDGLDACGKTTQAYRLVDYLQSRQKSVCLRIHPSDDNLLGRYAKRFLQSEGRNAHFTSALFYMLDVIHSVLKYSWRAKDYIVFVRYLLGTAYLPAPVDVFAYHFFATLVPKPEKTLYIDIEPDVAARRIRSRTQDTIEMFEKPEELRKMRQKGLALASLGKWRIILGNRALVDVESDIHRALGLK